jgi:hypothetical protein
MNEASGVFKKNRVHAASRAFWKRLRMRTYVDVSFRFRASKCPGKKFISNPKLVEVWQFKP